MRNFKILIPARKEKDGVNLNRRNFDSTISVIPSNIRRYVTVATNDFNIMKKCNSYGVKYIELPEKYSKKSTPIKSIAYHYLKTIKTNPNDIILVLKLDYLERSMDEIKGFLQYFNDKNCSSLLCKKDWKGKDFKKTMVDIGNGKAVHLKNSKPDKKDDLIEISYYMVAFKSKELGGLNSNMYNKDTIFYPLDYDRKIIYKDVEKHNKKEIIKKPKNEKRVLILGNSPEINDINFKKINKDVVTIGINRIFLKFIPDFLFFNDHDIMQELINKKDEINLKKLKCVSSDWIYAQERKNRKLKEIRKKFNELCPYYKIYSRKDVFKFPDSCSTAIQIFDDYYFKNVPKTYYMAGVKLKWEEKSHFWKGEYKESLNDKDKNWYTPRFEKIYQNFKSLNFSKNLISVTPNSKLNTIMSYQNIDVFYD